MTLNKDMPAMPIEFSGFGQCAPEVYTGLTKREMFAMHAMQGLLTCTMDTDCSIPELCADAVIAADSLLDELERTK